MTQPDRTSKFTAQLLDLIREIIPLGLAHAGKLRELTTAALRCDATDRVSVALALGSVDTVKDLNECMLRTELAEVLLDGAKLGKYLDGGRWMELKRLADSWKGSVAEDIRMRGWRLTERLAEKLGNPVARPAYRPPG